MYSFGLEILGKRLEKGIISFQRRLREGHPWFRTSKKKKKRLKKLMSALIAEVRNSNNKC